MISIIASETVGWPMNKWHQCLNSAITIVNLLLEQVATMENNEDAYSLILSDGYGQNKKCSQHRIT